MAKSAQISLLSYNIKGKTFYFKNASFDVDKCVKILQFITDQNKDIVCIQESQISFENINDTNNKLSVDDKIKLNNKWTSLTNIYSIIPVYIEEGSKGVTLIKKDLFDVVEAHLTSIYVFKNPIEPHSYGVEKFKYKYKSGDTYNSKLTLSPDMISNNTEHHIVYNRAKEREG